MVKKKIHVNSRKSSNSNNYNLIENIETGENINLEP